MISRERSWLRRVGRLFLPPFAFLVLLWLAPAASPGPLDSLPSISYTIDGIVGANGWYRGSAGGNYVVLRWSVSGADNTDCQIAVKVDGVRVPNSDTNGWSYTGTDHMGVKLNGEWCDKVKAAQPSAGRQRIIATMTAPRSFIA